MKKVLIYTALLCNMALMLAACGSKSSEAESSTDSAYTVAESGPLAILGRSYSTKEGDYTIDIACKADSSVVVKDALDTEFYDNMVTVSITKSGSPVFQHTFTRNEFKGSYDKQHSILQGMAYSERSNGQFLFGAQVGEPANDEGGENYRITVGPDGSFAIAPDFNQDTSSDGE